MKFAPLENMPKLQVLVAAKQCPSDPHGLPYMSIILTGAVADEIAMPCTTSQDTCSQTDGMICKDLGMIKPFGIDLFGISSTTSLQTPSSLNNAFFSAMEFIGLYDDKDAKPGCYTMSSLVSGISRGQVAHHIFHSANTQQSKLD